MYLSELKFNLFQRLFNSKLVNEIKMLDGVVRDYANKNNELIERISKAEALMRANGQKVQELELKTNVLEQYNLKLKVRYKKDVETIEKFSEANYRLVNEASELRRELDKSKNIVHNLKHQAIARDHAHEQEIKKIKEDADGPRKALDDMWAFIECKELTGEFQEMVRKNKENESTSN